MSLFRQKPREPHGQELINRYRWNYGIAKDTPLTEEMILAHWTLKLRLTQELLESSPEDRWDTFERCYTTLYAELEWLSRLTGQTDTTPASERYRVWADLIGEPPKAIYEVGSGKAAMIGYLAQIGHHCTATEITRQRGAKFAVEHANLRWTQTDGVHLGRFETDNHYDFVLSDNVIEHLHPDDLREHMAGARGILRRQGQYIFAVPHRWFGPADISKVFKYETAAGMHLKEYTYRELKTAATDAGFREIAAVSNLAAGPARADAALLRRIILKEAFLAPISRPILRGRWIEVAKKANITPLIFLAATK